MPKENLEAPTIDWVICGGESGPGARPCLPEWIRSLRDQCVAAGTAFYFKQWGEWLPVSQVNENQSRVFKSSQKKYTDSRADAFAGKEYWAKVGKKAAGRLLDGRTWDEMPEI